jgi:hypothetical protein
MTSSTTWTFPDLLVTPNSAWAVLLRDPDGLVLGAAVFIDVLRRDQLVATFAGSEGGFRVAPLAASEQAGTLLCRAVADELRQRKVAVDLGPVSVTEPLLHKLAGVLPTCELGPAEPVPYLRRSSDTHVEAYLSHGTRRTLRKARNRMAADEVAARVEYVRDRRGVVSLLPDMERTYRDRDHEGGRASLLDTPVGREIWRRRILGLIDTGHGEVAVLHLNDAFAAYVLGVRDECWYGIPEGRFRTEHARYAPGRLLEAAVVGRALNDLELHGVDWLSGVAPESLLAANGFDPTVRLVSRTLADATPESFQLPRPRAGEAVPSPGDAAPGTSVALAP